MPKGKILYCASTASHLENFHLPYIQAFVEQGYRITVCAEQQISRPFIADFFVVPFCKKMTSPENMKNIVRVYRYLKKNQFTAISVHTTLAAAVIRAAVLLLPKKQRPTVFYICHGYLFSKQDGWRKWIYLLPEKICAAVTDVLMVMNQEDQQFAEQYRLCKGNPVLIPGMGVNFSRFDILYSKTELRKKYELTEEDVLFVFAGEFSSRKNQQQLIAAFAAAVTQMPSAKLILAGSGNLLEDCHEQARKLNMQDKIIFTGQVADMPTLYHCCDICISASKIEGLPFHLMEAMYCGLPCIASKIKGHMDLIQHGATGYLYEDKLELVSDMRKLYECVELRQQLGQAAHQAVQQYDLSKVLPVIMQVYEEYL